MNDHMEEIWNDLVIVGGGPSTVIFLINMLKQGQLLSLFKGSGVSIIEKGRFFGSGRLEQYLIKGYSNSLDLFRIIIKEPHCYNKDLFKDYLRKDVRGQLYIDPKSIDEVMDKLVLIGFKEILMTNIYKELQKYGLNYPPLSAVGYFFRVIGNTLLRQIKNLKNQLIFRAFHEMESISLQNDGCININVKVNDPNGPQEQYYQFQQSPDSITPRQNRNIRPQVLDHYKKIRCKVLMLCIGAKPQPIYYSAMHFIPRGLSIHCDYFLTDKGFTSTMQLISKQKNKNKTKIVILGGNQNAFAAAQLLLKGPSIYSQSESRKSIMQINDGVIPSNQYKSPHDHSPPPNQIDSLSPFLHKRKLEQTINTNEQKPCERCAALQTKRRRSSIYQEDTVNLTNHSNQQNRLTHNISQQNSQFSSKLSTNANSYNSPNLGNSYLAKRTGLSNAGMSILNIQNINNLSNQYLNESRIQTRNGITPAHQFNRSNNSSFMLQNNLSSINSRNGGYSGAFQSQGLIKNPDGITQQQQHLQLQECLCLGSIKPLVFRWKREDANLMEISDSDIVIIYKDDIKVYYESEKEAKLVGQWNEELEQCKDKNGEMNYLTGLKGDAKALYLDIQKGYEKRVVLLKCNDENEINKHISESIMCIDASNFVNSLPLIKGVQGEVYDAKRDSQNWIMFDPQARILTEKGPIKNIFCMGFFAGVYLNEKDKSLKEESNERIHNINWYNEIESKRVCTSVIEAMQSHHNINYASWKWIDQIVLSQSQIFNNSVEPDYESANIMNFFKRDDELGIDKINKKMKGAKIGINFRGVDSYIKKKYMQPL